MDKGSWVQKCREIVVEGHTVDHERLGMKLYKETLVC